MLEPFFFLVRFIHALSFADENRAGIVCGSGLGHIPELIQNKIVIPYSELPGFPTGGVSGHKNELVFGDLNGKKVVAMRGRFHFYEGNGTTHINTYGGQARVKVEVERRKPEGS